MISEKTVELNLTTELTNWAWKIHRKTFTAIAPTQVQEANLGYDVSMMSGGLGIYIQYKRAEIKGTEYIYKLNRTSARDQHKKLFDLESTGVPVFYGLPVFTTVNEVISNRRRLLMHTLWLSPSSIPVPDGGTQHHELHYESTTGRTWVTSDDEVHFEVADMTISNIEKQITGDLKNNVIEAMSAFNKIFVGDQQQEETASEFDISLFLGGSMMTVDNE